LVAERGLTLVHPYDDARVMAGQGTVGLELAEAVPDLDVVLVPAGGGGLLAGCAVALRAAAPGVRIVGVEPEASDDLARSVGGGRVGVVLSGGNVDAARLASLMRG